MIKRNQLGVIFNAFQGKHKKVLTVCSAGCLRSPTAAHILSSFPWNFNTRCAGTSEEYAIVPVTEALIVWADVILVMDEVQQLRINTMQNQLASEYEAFDYKQVINLDIPDNYEYRDPRLLKIMNEKFEELFPEDEE
jgi:predicted protein tyrosine phosphatase